MEKTKEQRIKDEMKRLNDVFKDLSDGSKKSAKSMIQNAAFMAVTLEDLQNHINEHGVTETYQNGANQHGTKKSSEVEVHVSMTKNHTMVMRALFDLLPKQTVGKVMEDGFEDFINSK